MNQALLPQCALNNKQAITACEKLNAEIVAVETEIQAIESEAKAITESAISAGTSDDAKTLLKRVASLKERRLSVAMREMRIVAFNDVYIKAVKEAARIEADRLTKEFEDREKELNKCADGLGYPETGTLRTQLIRTDLMRNQLQGKVKDARSLSINAQNHKIIEEWRTGQLIGIIADALK